METMFCDLSKCEPASALTRRMKNGHWRMIDYETDEMRGTMLIAGEETWAPEVRLKLGLEGWHAIYLGLYGTGYTQFPSRVKLSGDACFRELVRDRPNAHSLEEAFFKNADLTGQDLVIAQRLHEPGTVNSLAYVRCVKLSDEELAVWQKERERTDTRRLVVYNDGVSIFSDPSPRTEDEIWQEIEPFADSDVKVFCYGIPGDHSFFPTRIGVVEGSIDEDYLSRSDRISAASVQTLIDKGINPVKTAADYAHRIGLEFHLYYRMETFTSQPPGDYATYERMVGKHPEWRCVNRNGRSMAHMSYAYPDVRDFVVSMLEEAAPWGADGVNLYYKRGAPFVMYEEPLIEGFKDRYEEDPREIDEFDERWLQYRSGPLTEFMRQLRERMDDIGKAAGKRIVITAGSFATEAENVFYGLDLPLWIEEGLVDYLAPMGDVHGCPEIDVDYYAGLVKGTACKFYPQLPVRYRYKTPAGCVKGAHKYYAAGADGLSFWDCPHRQPLMFQTFRRLGHVDDLDPACEEPEPKTIPLRVLGHVDLRDGHIPLDYERVGKVWSLHYIYHAH